MIRFGELYFHEWFADVYSILVENEEVGLIYYNEYIDHVDLCLLKFDNRFKDHEKEWAYESIKLLQSMFPGKRIEGITQECMGTKFWEELGASCNPDPDDEYFTIFNLDC